MNMTVLEATESTVILTDLRPNTYYIVSICASTSVGCGPPAEVTNKTDEDSEYNNASGSLATLQSSRVYGQVHA